MDTWGIWGYFVSSICVSESSTVIRMEINNAIGHTAISSESGTPNVILYITENSQVFPIVWKELPAQGQPLVVSSQSLGQ